MLDRPLNTSTPSAAFLSVRNTTDETVPPYGAMRIVGRGYVDTAPNGSTSRAEAFLVAKPDKDDLDNVIFNGPGPILPHANGQANNYFPCPAAYSRDNPDGSDPAAGETWGTRAGEWVLFQGQTGFSVHQASNNGVCGVMKRVVGGVDQVISLTTSTLSDYGNYAVTLATRDAAAWGLGPRAWGIDLSGSADGTLTAGTKYVAIRVRDHKGEPVSEAGGEDGDFLPLYAFASGSATVVASSPIGPQLRITDGVLVNGNFACKRLTIDPETDVRTVGPEIWGNDLSNAEALVAGNDYLCHELGDGPGGRFYVSASDDNLDNALTDTAFWFLSLSDPASVRAFAPAIVDAIDISDGDQVVLDEPGDFASTLTMEITDSDTSITVGTVQFVGADAAGEPLDETIDIANGGTHTYTTAGAFKTVASVTVADLTGEAAGDTIEVKITQYPAGILRTDAGNTYGVNTATDQAPGTTDWTLLASALTSLGGYSSTTTYAAGDVTQRVLPKCDFNSMPTGGGGGGAWTTVFKSGDFSYAVQPNTFVTCSIGTGTLGGAILSLANAGEPGDLIVIRLDQWDHSHANNFFLLINGVTHNLLLPNSTLSLAGGNWPFYDDSPSLTFQRFDFGGTDFGWRIIASHNAFFNDANQYRGRPRAVSDTVVGLTFVDGWYTGGAFDQPGVDDAHIASSVVWNAKLGPTSDGSTLTGLTKAQVGLSNVENTALSTWAGSTNITTVGALTGYYDSTATDAAIAAGLATITPTTLGLVIGTDVQAWSAALDTFAATPLIIGSNVQAYSANLDTLATLDGSTLTGITPAQVGALAPSDLGVTVQAWSTNLDTLAATPPVIGSNVQAWSANLDLLSGLDGSTLGGITPAQIGALAPADIGVTVQVWSAVLDAVAVVVPIADGTYTVGIGPTTNGTITVQAGLITAITEAT